MKEPPAQVRTAVLSGGSFSSSTFLVQQRFYAISSLIRTLLLDKAVPSKPVSCIPRSHFSFSSNRPQAISSSRGALPGSSLSFLSEGVACSLPNKALLLVVELVGGAHVSLPLPPAVSGEAVSIRPSHSCSSARRKSSGSDLPLSSGAPCANPFQSQLRSERALVSAHSRKLNISAFLRVSSPPHWGCQFVYL